MNIKRKADALATRIGSNPFDYLQGNQKAFSTLDCRKNQPFGQCVKCLSDYMKFSVNGYCQRCLQKIEFIVREHPQVLRQISASGGKHK